MTVGDSIFLSAILLGIIGLYAATKDRWKWKKLVKWGVGVPVLLMVLGGLALWGYYEYDDRPTAQASLDGFTFGSTAADVKLTKGNPNKVLEDTRWLYYAGSGSAEITSAGYLVRFKDGKVRYVMYAATPKQIIHPWQQGFTIGTSYEVVVKKLGPPSNTSISADGLERMVSYAKFNTFYTFEQGKVIDFGLYDPAMGPMEYTVPAPAGATPAVDAKDPLGLFPNGVPSKPASGPK